MKSKVGFILLGWILAFAIGFNMPVNGQPYPGDCNGDTFTNAIDLQHLITYLFMGGPPPVVMSDCDCDGFPGVNFADIPHLAGFLYVGCPLYVSPGTDFPVPSLVHVTFNTSIPPNQTNFSVPINVDVPANLNIESFVLPFSYESFGTQATTTCVGIDVTGTVSVVPLQTSYNNTDKILYITVMDPSFGGALPGGTKGLLATANFDTGPGDPNSLVFSPTSDKRLWPMLVAKNCYDGIDGTRVLIPCAFGVPYGDVNCDGKINVSDAILTINYIFVPGSPPPGDCEPY